MKVEQMERQLASLTGLVHKALNTATSPRPDNPINQPVLAPSPSPRLTPNQIAGVIGQVTSPRLIANQQQSAAVLGGPVPSPRLLASQNAGAASLSPAAQDPVSSVNHLPGKSPDFLTVPVKSSSGKNSLHAGMNYQYGHMNSRDLVDRGRGFATANAPVAASQTNPSANISMPANKNMVSNPSRHYYYHQNTQPMQTVAQNQKSSVYVTRNYPSGSRAKPYQPPKDHSVFLNEKAIDLRVGQREATPRSDSPFLYKKPSML